VAKKCIWVEPEMHEKLTAIKKRTFMPLEEIVRRALNEYMERNQEVKCPSN
jgi:hypothetical protein